MAQSVDMSGLANFLVEHSQDLAVRATLGREFANHFTIDNNVQQGKTYDELSVTPKLKAYTGIHAPEAGKIAFKSPTMQVGVFQDDYNIDPEVYRRKYMGVGVDISGRQIPKMQETIQQIFNENMDILDLQMIWNSDTSLTPTASNTHLTQVDGLKKQFYTARTNASTSGIKVASTGTLTVSNIIDSVLKVDDANDPGVKMKPRNIFISRANWLLYISAWKTKYPFGNPFNQNTTIQSIVLEETGGLAKLCPAYWMGTSNNIISTPQSNIIFGTDIQAPEGQVFSSVPTVYGLDMGFKLQFGILLRSPREAAINEL